MTIPYPSKGLNGDYTMNINKVLITDALRTVQKTKSRFFSIIAIVALGVSFFAGMNAISPDMYDTMQQYALDSNMSDIQIISTAGLTDNDIAVIQSINGIESAVGEKFVDGVIKVNGNPISDTDGSEMTVRALPLDLTKLANLTAGTDDRSFMNRPQLIEGSWPTSPNQCVVDDSALSTPDEFQIGSVVSVEGENKDLTKSLSNQEFTIVGIIRSPLYISYERGYTNIGTGKLGTFIYIPSENFLDPYYSVMYVKVAGSDSYNPHSKEYDAFIEQYTDYITSISPELISGRINNLKSQYTAEVSKAEIDYAQAKATAEEKLAAAEEQMKEILDMAENGDQKLLEYKQQYNEKALEAKNAIDSGKFEHSTQYALWESKMQEYNETKALLKQHENAEQQYNSAKTELNVAKLQVESMSSTVDYLSDLVVTTRSALDNFEDTQSGGVDGIVDRLTQSGIVGEEMDQIISTIKTMTAVGTAKEMAAYMEPQLQQLEVKLATSKKDLANAKTTLAQKEAELRQAEQMIAQLKQAQAQMETAEAELQKAEKELTNAGYDIQFGELEVLTQLSDMKNQINLYETSLAMAKEKASTIEADFATAKQQTEEKLESARLQLEDAKQFLLNLDNAKWTVSNRDDSLLGFEGYAEVADRTAALSAIFPWFFFLVAALVCLNTMTRMIEEDRTRLGTFKALGLTDIEIMSKYIIYSLLASSIGSIAGCLFGFVFFPFAATTGFQILFDMPAVITSFRPVYAFTGIIISVSITVFAAYYTCYKSLAVVPSTLMRSKAPVSGKKIILENLPFIWKKLNFTWKVTLRNVFRNMKRFVMATLGVAGCTALLVAGFGLNDAINDTMANQFTNDDRIWSYDMQIVLNGDFDTTIDKCNGYEAVKNHPLIGSASLSYMKVFNAVSDDGETLREAYLLVPEESVALSNYINLRERVSRNQHILSDTGAIITEKLAKDMGVSPGGYISLQIDDDAKVQIPVAAVTENYAFHYVYLSKALYSSIFGGNPRYNYITANFAIDNVTNEQKVKLNKEFLDEYEISAVAFTDQIQDSFANILDSISFIVIILIVSAGLLAFIVLYNLSIINITERIKEIATLKVLGFDDGEVSAYIFRENVILSIIGMTEGVIMGILLHKLVLFMAEIDIVMYGREINFVSYIYSLALAFGFSMFVSVVLHNKLKKVDMVESLKSIE